MYIYERLGWPNFTWDTQRIGELLAIVKFNQGLLLGKMSELGFAMRDEAVLQTLTSSIIKTSEIEGEHLDADEVRSSIAKHLGIKIAGQIKTDRSIDGVVEIHLDATQHCDKPLTEERLCGWHAALFPRGFSGIQIINPGHFRIDSEGPMQVVSGGYGREKIHFQAPPANKLSGELQIFLTWFNAKPKFNLLIKAGIAHLWFVTLHPFDDGNGRIARAIADMVLARSDNQKNRYYSMSTQIRNERKKYYEIVESTQRNNLDITPWLEWFLGCLDRAINQSEIILKNVFNKAAFWKQHAAKSFNQRQIEMLNVLFDGFKGVLTSSKWAKMTKCSQDTAARDIQQLIENNILVRSAEGGRSTHYELKEYPINYIS